MLTNWFVIGVLPFLISLALCGVIIRYSGRRLIDLPNLRSSHNIPTPRGGGIALAFAAVVAVSVAVFCQYIEPDPIYWLLLLAGLISILGALDDLHNLNVGVRLVAQILLAGIGVWVIGVNEQLPPLVRLPLALMMVFFVVWMTNLYNFMDGINGLAALEAISVCAGIAFISWMHTSNAGLIYLLLIIAASAGGFLFWNFPNAKLFMGDAGSLFLGLSFGLLTIHEVNQDIRMLAAWLILLGVFIVDATYTLAYRLATRQMIHQAHRSHAYQKITAKFGSHVRITLGVVAINLFWLLPIAFVVTATQWNPVALLVLAYTPLLLIAYKFQAGKPE